MTATLTHTCDWPNCINSIRVDPRPDSRPLTGGLIESIIRPAPDDWGTWEEKRGYVIHLCPTHMAEFVPDYLGPPDAPWNQPSTTVTYQLYPKEQ